MGTYNSSNPLMSETNQSASIPRFAWFHPGTFFSSAKTGYNPLRPSHTEADVGINPIPLQSIPPPPNEAPNDAGTPIGHAKAKKPKTPKQSSDNVGSEQSKKPKRCSKTPSKKAKGSTMSGAKRERKDLNFAAYKGNLDITGVPAPFCSCTGVPRQCYKWGAGGWQSSCCTINVSEYPLPMSTTRPGSRMAGRKMSHGAFEKLLRRLAGDGFDLSQPVDLRVHWARHGTNKFVTIK